jgi:hypothetical protein
VRDGRGHLPSSHPLRPHPQVPGDQAEARPSRLPASGSASRPLLFLWVYLPAACARSSALEREKNTTYLLWYYRLLLTYSQSVKNQKVESSFTT